MFYLHGDLAQANNRKNKEAKQTTIPRTEKDCEKKESCWNWLKSNGLLKSYQNSASKEFRWKNPYLTQGNIINPIIFNILFINKFEKKIMNCINKDKRFIS